MSRPLRKRSAFLFLSSAAAVAVPKCPLCLIPLLGISGAAGSIAFAWLTPATMAGIKLAMGAVSLVLLTSILWRKNHDRCSRHDHPL